MPCFHKPNIYVSKCLGFAMCRYNGQTVNDEFIDKLKEHVNIITHCPEVEIGLGVPRFPIRIVMTENGKRLVQPQTGDDVTGKMLSFAEGLLGSLAGIDGFILKERSPSCGTKGVKIYHKNGMTLKSSGQGLFAEKVIEHFPEKAVEEEGRLKSFKIREHFLTRIYTSAGFRHVKKQRSSKELTEFHARNKFLLMAYSEKEMRALGRIAANPERKDIDSVLADYEKHLMAAMKNMPKRPSMINSLQHIMGFFKDSATRKEKDFFLASIELYRDERIPLSSLLSMLRLWTEREDNRYLSEQTMFEPFPLQLMELKDSGKKLDL